MANRRRTDNTMANRRRTDNTMAKMKVSVVSFSLSSKEQIRSK